MMDELRERVRELRPVLDVEELFGDDTLVVVVSGWPVGLVK